MFQYNINSQNKNIFIKYSLFKLFNQSSYKIKIKIIKCIFNEHSNNININNNNKNQNISQ